MALVDWQSQKERFFVTGVAVALAILCGAFLKDLGEPGHSYHIRVGIGLAYSIILSAGSLLIWTSIGRRVWLLTLLVLVVCGILTSAAMIAYGWTSGILSLLFYIYVWFSFMLKWRKQ